MHTRTHTQKKTYTYIHTRASNVTYNVFEDVIMVSQKLDITCTHTPQKKHTYTYTHTRASNVTHNVFEEVSRYLEQFHRQRLGFALLQHLTCIHTHKHICYIHAYTPHAYIRIHINIHT